MTKWVWIQDEVIDKGAIRCLAILGIPTNGKKDDLTLNHDDMQVIALIPTVGLKSNIVTDSLKECEKRTGKPSQTINDAASNLKKGTRDYIREDKTVQIQDITHKIALLLEKTLKNDPGWTKFLEAMSMSKRKVKQTELAAIMPPNLREKARYMGADIIIKWGRNIEAVVKKESSNNRLQKYFGWVEQFSPHLSSYSKKMDICNIVKDIIRREGYSKDSYEKIKECILKMESEDSKDFINQALTIVLEEVKKLPEGIEKAFGSSEVLESIFGKYKFLNRNSNRGITANILSIPAFVGRKEKSDIKTALETFSVKELLDWTKKSIGTTMNSLRTKFFGTGNKKCKKIFETNMA